MPVTRSSRQDKKQTQSKSKDPAPSTSKSSKPKSKDTTATTSRASNKKDDGPSQILTMEQYARLIRERQLVRGRAIEYALPFSTYIDRFHWHKFTEAPTVGVIDWVEEFYASLWFKPGQPPVVQGCTIDFSPVAINNYYGLTVLGDDGEDTLRYPVTYTPEVSKSLSGPKRGDVVQRMFTPFAQASVKLGSEFGRIRRKWFTTEAKVWLYFVSANLIPSEHVSEFSPDRVKLAYAIMDGMGIDVGQFIYDNILAANTLDKLRRKRTLPFSNLITALCLSAGLEEPSNPNLDMLDPAKVIRMHDYLPKEDRNIQQEYQENIEPGHHFSPPSPHQRTSSPPTSHRPESSSSYASIHARFDTIEAAQAALAASQVEILQQLAHITHTIEVNAQRQQEWSTRLEASLFEDPEPYPGQPRPPEMQVYRRRLRRSARPEDNN